VCDDQLGAALVMGNFIANVVQFELLPAKGTHEDEVWCVRSCVRSCVRACVRACGVCAWCARQHAGEDTYIVFIGIKNAVKIHGCAYCFPGLKILLTLLIIRQQYPYEAHVIQPI
jgi:hypothetical protein